MIELSTAQTFLFVPGDRPDRFDKAAATAADLVVIDLEDAVAPDCKAVARNHVIAWLDSGHRCAVRINALSDDDGRRDIEALGDRACPIMLPKAEDPRVIADLLSGRSVLALVETARGVLSAAAIALAEPVARLAFGSFDLAAGLGVDPDDREALATARCALVLASAAAGLAAPVDGVTAAVDDAEAVTDDTRYARRLGFGGKLCIHPAQVAHVSSALAPTDAEIQWAQEVLTVASGSAVAKVGGRLVDKPVIDRARLLLSRRMS